MQQSSLGETVDIGGALNLHEHTRFSEDFAAADSADIYIFLAALFYRHFDRTIDYRIEGLFDLPLLYNSLALFKHLYLAHSQQVFHFALTQELEEQNILDTIAVLIGVVINIHEFYPSSSSLVAKSLEL